MQVFGVLNGYEVDADDRDSTGRGSATHKHNMSLRKIDFCEYIVVITLSLSLSLNFVT